MRDSSQRGGCWPTPTQILLLRAALLDGEEALVAWRAWQSATDIEALDLGSTRLLPLLGWNLKRLGVRDAQTARYASVSRHQWVRNQLLFEQGARVLEALARHSVPTLLLKGADLAHRVYPRVAARPMNDFDVLVPGARAREACEVMEREGFALLWWRSPAPPPDAYFSLFHAHSFLKRTPRGGIEVDIHRAIFPTGSGLSSEALWLDSAPFELRGVPTRVLRPENALLHVVSHGAVWNEVPPVRWIADAVLILRATPGFDWTYFVRGAKQHGVAVGVRRALRFLAGLELNADIPAQVLRELSAIPTSRAARREQTLLSRSHHGRSLFDRLWLRSQDFTRWNRALPPSQRPLSLARYLPLSWGFATQRESLGYGWKRLADALSRR